MNDKVDKLVIFLAKRDGIDKLVKTFQYVSELLVWHLETTKAKQCEVASGLSRKAFKYGRFLTGFNALRRNPGPTPTYRFSRSLLTLVKWSISFLIISSGYQEQELWMQHLLRDELYIGFWGITWLCVFLCHRIIMIKEGIEEEKKIRTLPSESKDNCNEIKKIKVNRVMRLMAVAANVADLIIGLAEIEPNPFCNHAVTLGISGLVSAWAGWYRNWSS